MKGICKLLSVTIIAVSLQMPFSIFSYAVGYDFSEMGDTDNQSFSGHNDVYTNGIYVGGSGTNIYFDTIMENSNNTYNGTSDIDNTAYPADSYDSRSTYNGTLNVNANDVLSSAGINYVNEATVNANTNVSVNDVLADNTLNAGVQFNDSEFNGDVTLSGSGDVNLAGSTVNNLVIGNIPLMSNLIELIAYIWDNLNYNMISTTQTRSFSFGGNTYSYLGTTNSLVDRTLYTNLRGSLELFLRTIIFNLNYIYTPALYNDGDPLQKSFIVNGYPYVFNRVPIYSYSYNSSTDVVSSSYVYRYKTFAGFLYETFFSTIPSYFNANVNYLADTWYRWYNPNISAADSKFWIAFNTDTEVYDHVNLSTVFGYITWYLGQLYIQGNEAASDISQSVTNLDTTLSTLEQKEAQINTQIKNSADDIDDFFNLPTIVNLGVILGWLQYMWVSLDIFQSVTYIGWALILLSIIAGFYKVKQGYV